MPRTLVALCSFLLLALVARGASADSGALAETLFLEGKEMMKQGNLEEACKRFKASHQAEPSVGAILNLARCHHKRGMLASAWSEYKEGATLAEQMHQRDRKAGALKFAAEIEPLLSKLTIEVAQPVEGLKVRRNGIPLPPGAYGVAVPVDPGPHEVVAEAPGHVTWRKEITIGAEKDLQTIAIPELTPAETPAGQPEPDGEGMHPRAIAGLVLGGVGLASLAVGIALGAVAIDQDGELMCNDGVCNPTEYEKVQDIKPIAHAATATIAIGAAAVIAGGILYLTAPSAEPVEAAMRVFPVVSPEFQGFGITGTF